MPRFRHAVPPIVVAGLTFLAWKARFIQDDAFISFRYADNLARGNGLVWNVGERIEGFTNFLWTLAIALGLRLGLEPVGVSYALGLGCFAATLLFFHASIELLGVGELVSLGATVVLGTNFTFLSYATGGLETQSQALFFAWTLYLLARHRGHAWSQRDLLVLSFVLAGAVWTRLDSALLALVVGLAAVVDVAADRARPTRARLVDLAFLAVPFVTLVGGLFVFKVVYFGDLLPNTFYAKAEGTGSGQVMFERGGRFVLSFLSEYWFLPTFLLALLACVRAVRSKDRVVLAVLLSVVLWVLYVMKVGGDFMEYRFFVPVLPAILWLAVWSLDPVRARVVLVALGASAVVASYVHYVRTSKLGFIDELGTESIHALDAHIEDPNQAWGDVGKALGAAFDHDPNVTIAVMAAGAICYYSRLTSIDMLGLNDKWIARHGVHLGDRPGHQKGASLQYLLDRHVNLIVHPWMKGDAEERITSYTLKEVDRYIHVPDPERLPADSEIVEMPVRPGRSLRMLYLVRSPKVDAVVRSAGWREFPIQRAAKAE